jgi:hypothetical protein
VSGTAVIDGTTYTMLVHSHRCLPRTWYYRGRRYYSTTCTSKRRTKRTAKCPQKCLDEIDAIRDLLRKLKLKHADDDVNVKIRIKKLEALLKALEDRVKAAEDANGEDAEAAKRQQAELEALKKQVQELAKELEELKKKEQRKMWTEVLGGGVFIPVGSGHMAGGFGLKLNMLWPVSDSVHLGLSFQASGNFREYNIMEIHTDDVRLPTQNWAGGLSFALAWMFSKKVGLVLELGFKGVVEYASGRLTGEFNDVLNGVRRRLSGFVAGEINLGLRFNFSKFRIQMLVGWMQPFMPRLEAACGLAGCPADEHYMGDLMISMWFGFSN